MRTKSYHWLIKNYQSEYDVLMYELEEKMKNLFTFLILFLIISFQIVIAQTTLSAGDIAFIGWNSDGNDDMLILTFVDIDANTTIYFRDDNYDNGWCL